MHLKFLLILFRQPLADVQADDGLQQRLLLLLEVLQHLRAREQTDLVASLGLVRRRRGGCCESERKHRLFPNCCVVLP